MEYNRLYYWLCAIAVMLIGCNPDAIDGVSFDVSVGNGSNTVHVGEEVEFLFSGNASYVSFYSGENGNSYLNRNRTEVKLKSLTLDASFKQQYTDKEYYNQELLNVYISEDFNSTYTVDGIKKSTWKKISGQTDGTLHVPAPSSSAAQTASSTLDLDAYANKGFYIAFEYKAPKRKDVPKNNGGGKYTQAPRIDVLSLLLNKETADGEFVKLSNTATDWGFQIVYENSEKKGTYLVNDESLLFQPQAGKEHNDDDIIVWMVSQKLKPNAVSPDRGTAIKGTDVYLSSYTYIYSKPGTYTATFIGTNANLWNSKQMIKEIKINVVE